MREEKGDKKREEKGTRENGFCRFPSLFTLHSLLFTVSLLFTLHSSLLYAVESSVITAQQSEKERIKSWVAAFLDQALGKGKSSVLDVEIRITIKGKELQQAAGATVGKSEGAGGTRMIGMGQRSQTLPGFPTPLDPKFGNVTPVQDGSSQGQSQMQQMTSVDLPGISRVVRIVAAVDKNIPKEVLEQAKDTLSKVYKIGKQAVEFLPADFVFAKTSRWWEGFLSPGYILASVLLLPLIYFLFMMGGGLSKIASAVAIARTLEATVSQTTMQKTEGTTEAAGGAGGGAGGGGAGGGGFLGMGGGGPAAEIEYKTAEEEPAHKPFSFVKKENLVNLLYLILEETPETVAIIINYLDPELQSEVLNAVSPEMRSQVAMTMAIPRLADKADVYAVEKNIKDKIYFLVGGLESFIRILGSVDNRTRHEMLDTLEKQSPRLAAKAKEEIFFFENLADLPDLTVQFILRETRAEQLAVALRGAGTEKVMAKISANSSEGFRARLREEMDFGKPLAAEQIEEAQREIEKTVKEMEAKKLIVLREKAKKGIELEGRLQRLELGGAAEASGSAKRAQEEFDAGVAAYSAEKMAEAIAHFQRSVQHDPNRWEAWQYLGTCLYSGGRNDEAFSAYDKALVLNPENVQLAEWLAEEKKKRV